MKTPVTFEDFRTAARALPEVEDATSYGTPALKVRGKLMARVHQDQDLNCCILRIDLRSMPDALDRLQWGCRRLR